jgi:hemerythrin-like domain-containing protein
MMPIGPLMIEHRLIERVIDLLDGWTGRVVEKEQVDPALIDTVVDFIRTYADRTHHGKEEDILFRELAEKPLSKEHRGLMQTLVDEHVYARETVGALVRAKARCVQGDQAASAEALPVILEKISALVALYPGHIEREDKVFFPAAMQYLDRSEQEAMLQEMWEFDKHMIHEKYRTVVEQLERESGQHVG